jgi:hypothetical protein
MTGGGKKVVKEMRNSECLIYITSKRGSVQSFRKEKDKWFQTSSKGIERTCTAEQVLSHILPYLAYKQKYEKLGTLKVEVKDD